MPQLEAVGIEGARIKKWDKNIQVLCEHPLSDFMFANVHYFSRRQRIVIFSY